MMYSFIKTLLVPYFRKSASGEYPSEHEKTLSPLIASRLLCISRHGPPSHTVSLIYHLAFAEHSIGKQTGQCLATIRAHLAVEKVKYVLPPQELRTAPAGKGNFYLEDNQFNKPAPDRRRPLPARTALGYRLVSGSPFYRLTRKSRLLFETNLTPGPSPQLFTPFRNTEHQHE